MNHNDMPRRKFLSRRWNSIMDEPVELPIEDWIDLHTFQPRDVASVVEEYLYQALLRGFCEVRIVHGRGIGVQREIVHSVLKRHPKVLCFRDTEDRGATLVSLRHES